jgi:hypothetical protein
VLSIAQKERADAIISRSGLPPRFASNEPLTPGAFAIHIHGLRRPFGTFWEGCFIRRESKVEDGLQKGTALAERVPCVSLEPPKIETGMEAMRTRLASPFFAELPDSSCEKAATTVIIMV